MISTWKTTTLSQDNGLHNNKIASLLLSSRNVGDLDSFTSPKFNGLSDPSSIFGCSEMAELFARAIREKWKIAVIGDYDVDGVVSAAMLEIFFKAFGVETHIFLPHRIEHGYGLNKRTMDSFLTDCDFKPDLVIAADCGTSSEDEIKKLKDSGVPMVAVIDHHKPNDGMFSKSADVVMNWRLGSGEETCTAGQIFHLARRYSKKHLLAGEKMPEDLSKFLPMAAIAIVADIMPITGDNRIIVRKGLERMSSAPVGLRALAEKCGMVNGAITQKDVSFRLAPKINAAGRIDSPVGAFSLIMENDEGEAESHVEVLTNWNKERQIIQKKISKEAIEQAKKSGFKNGILVHNPDWHIGVVGIVASKIVEEFGVPAIVIGESEGKRKGSARSVQGVSVKTVMDDCSEIFEAYGGHDMAAGCTLHKDFYDAAAEAFDASCARWYEEKGRPDTSKKYDMELDIQDLNLTTAKALKETLYPYCDACNPEPVFKVSNVEFSRIDTREGDNWRRTNFRCRKNCIESDLRFVTFSSDYDEFFDKPQNVDIYFSFGQNVSGDWPPDLEILDIIPHND